MADFQALRALVDFSQVDDARKKLGELKDEIPGAGAAVDGLTEVVKALENPLLAIGTAFITAATGAISLGFQSIELADHLNDLSAKSGRSIEYLQILGEVAEKSGSNLDTMSEVLDQIQKKSVAGGEDGKKTAAAYEYLGVKARDASGALKDAATLGEEGAAALDRLGHSADATAAFQDAFGTSALKNIATLQDLNKNLDDQYEFLASVGALMDGNLAKASDNYNDKLHDLGSVFKGLGSDIARMMLPMLTGMADMLINSAKNSGVLSVAMDVLKGALWLVTSALKGILTFFVMVDNGFSNLVQSISLGGKVIWAALTGNWDEIPKMWEDYKTRIVKTNEDAAATVGGIWSTVDAAPQSKDDFKNGKTPPPGTPGYHPPQKDAKEGRGPRDSDIPKELDSQMRSLMKLRGEYEAFFGIQAATNTQMVEAAILADKYGEKRDATGKITIKAATAEQIAQLRANAADEDALVALNRKTKAEQAAWAQTEKFLQTQENVVTAARKDAAENAIRLKVLSKVGATTDDVTLALDDYNISQAQTALTIARASGEEEHLVVQRQKELDVLRELKQIHQDKSKDNNDADDAANTFQNGWATAFDAYKKQATNAAETGKQVFQSVTGHMGSALENFVMTGKLNFKDLTKSILADLAKIAMQKAIVGMASAMFADGGGFSGGTQFMATGGTVSSPTTVGFADGKRLVAGEAGDEGILPLKRNSRGQMGVIAQMGGGQGSTTQVNNNIEVHIGSVDSPDRVQELQRSIKDIVVSTTRETMASEMRKGGMLNPVR